MLAETMNFSINAEYMHEYSVHWYKKQAYPTQRQSVEANQYPGLHLHCKREVDVTELIEIQEKKRSQGTIYVYDDPPTFIPLL